MTLHYHMLITELQAKTAQKLHNMIYHHYSTKRSQISYHTAKTYQTKVLSNTDRIHIDIALKTTANQQAQCHWQASCRLKSYLQPQKDEIHPRTHIVMHLHMFLLI